jgi:O-antigen/teichoic acid export membrane protein
MPSWIREFLGKGIVQVFIGSGASSLVKIITTIILSKVVAEELGPDGLGLIGQLTSFVSIALLFASGGFQNGIISYTALNHARGDLAEFVKPSMKLTLMISAVCGVVLILLAGQFSMIVFKTPDLKYPFYCFGFSVIFYSYNTFFNSFLNGISDYKAFNFLNIINSLFSLVVSVLLIYWLDIKGALLAVVLSQTLTSFATFWFIRRFKKIFSGFHKARITKHLVKSLSPYVKMTVFSLILLPVSQIMIRNMVFQSKSHYGMGIWEAVTRISGMYLMVIFNIMLVYYLPKLSVIDDKQSILREYKKGGLFFGGVLVVIGLTVYFLRYYIIELFLSESFLEVADLILLQLVGDFFRVLYCLFAYFAIAKSLMRYYIGTEIILFSIYITLAYILIPIHGIEGSLFAYAIMTLIGFGIHACCLGYMYFFKHNKVMASVFRHERIGPDLDKV